MSKYEITALFEKWNAALQTGDPKNVAILYEKNGILIPTMSNKIRHNREEIEGYFVCFLAKGPMGKIHESNVRIFGQLAINSGIYIFTFRDGSEMSARFTFVYRNNGEHWLIAEHHSSQMAE